MLNAFGSFSPAYKLIFKDKVNLLLSVLPILIGVLLYFVAGRAFFTFALDYGNQYIESYISNETFGGVLTFLVGSILSILMFFIVNWTFVLFLSILASPFNDILSHRIEKLYLHESLPGFKDGMEGIVANFIPTILNEIKKVALIVLFSSLALIFGFFPILLPISVGITILLLASEYIDYSWSRHNLEFKKCRKDMFKNIFSYGVGGSFFMLLVSIPLLNILVPSFATSYFTILWIKNNEHSHKTA